MILVHDHECPLQGEEVAVFPSLVAPGVLAVPTYLCADTGMQMRIAREGES